MVKGLEIFYHRTAGYMPLVYSQEWMVALLNYEDAMAVDNAIHIERHIQTNEVFILLRGHAAFYLVAEQEPLKVIEIEPLLVYNITPGTWHNILATPDVVLALIENRDTDKFDTQVRLLNLDERERLLMQLPKWLKSMSMK